MEENIIPIDIVIRHCWEDIIERTDWEDDVKQERIQIVKWLEELKDDKDLIEKKDKKIERLSRNLKLLRKDIKEYQQENKALKDKISYLYKEMEEIALMTVPTENKERSN